MFLFCLVFAVFCARLFVSASWSPAGGGGGGGGGWPLGSRLWCLLWVCRFPVGVLGRVWCLVVSIPDLCNLTYFAQGPQHSDAGEARTRGPSVSRQALHN